MKVLHIASGDLWAGAEVQIYTLLSQLALQLDVCAILLNEGELAHRLRASKIAVIILPENTLNGIQLFRAILSNILKFQPDIVHTHRQKENILASIACFYYRFRYRQRIASLRTVHGSSEYEPKGLQHIYKLLDWLAGNYIQQGIIAVSSDLAIKLKNRFKPERIITLHNGINRTQLEKITPASDIAHKDQFQVGIVGRIEPVKRIDLFLEIAKELLSLIPTQDQIRFHVIGDGKLKKKMELYAHSLGIQDSVIFHGYRNDSINCLKALDCLIMCSDHEGTPMTILEALSLSTPVVVHGVGGLLEILPENSHNLVFDQNAKQYAEAVSNQLLQKIPCPRLSNQYDAAFNAAKMIELYTRLVRSDENS